VREPCHPARMLCLFAVVARGVHAPLAVGFVPINPVAV
jgi:hypothetical protein